MTDLHGRIILITGAGDGIGRETAVQAAANGATVVLLGRNIEKLEAVFDQIIEAGHQEPCIVPMDLANIGVEDTQKLFKALDNNYGRLDCLLHNASILGGRLPIEQYNAAQWQLVIQVNLNATFLLTQSLLPLLHRSSDGRLIFTSSSVGRVPRAYWGAYSVSKYAVEGLAKLLIDELENTSSIQGSIVNPGATRTRMRAEAYPMEDPRELKSPSDLMPLYLYLIGPESEGDKTKYFDSSWLDTSPT